MEECRPNGKPEEKEDGGYSEYRDGDLAVCDMLCDVCVYRFAGDVTRCKKYPQGKPEEILDPDYFCEEFAMNDGIGE